MTQIRKMSGRARDIFAKIANVTLIALGFLLVFFSAYARPGAVRPYETFFGAGIAHADAPSCTGGDSAGLSCTTAGDAGFGVADLGAAGCGTGGCSGSGSGCAGSAGDASAGCGASDSGDGGCGCGGSDCG